MNEPPIPESAIFSRSSKDRAWSLTASPTPRVNVRELRRSYDRRVRLPKTLVEELARTTSLAQGEWVSARAANDFARFRPWLERIFQLKREESACLQSGLGLTRGGQRAWPETAKFGRAVSPHPAAAGQAMSVSTYDPLIDEYEPGATAAQLAILFQELRRELVPMVSAITDAIRRRTARHFGRSESGRIPGRLMREAVLKRFYPRERQKVFGEGVAAAIGFDFSRGRLDVTAHPFCSGIGPGDCRITTRYDEHHFSEAFSGHPA